MLDTLRITFNNKHDNCLRNNDWTQVISSSGELQKQFAILKLNCKKDTDTEKETYVGTLKIEYSHTNQYLNLSVSSLPALLYGTSYKTISHEDTKRIPEALYKEIEPYVKTDFKTGIITRLDNSVIYNMNSSVANYILLLNSITRTKQFHCVKKYYEAESVELFNRLRTVAFYDKFKKNQHNTSEQNIVSPGNLLRYEVQNKCLKSVKKVFGKELNVYDLQTEQTADLLHKQRLTEFQKHFRFKHEQDKIRLQDFLNTQLFMKTKHKRFALEKTMWFIALQKGIISIEELRVIMQISGYSRQYIYKKIEQLNQLLASDVKKTELYTELKTKIEAA